MDRPQSRRAPTDDIDQELRELDSTDVLPTYYAQAERINRIDATRTRYTSFDVATPLPELGLDHDEGMHEDDGVDEVLNSSARTIALLHDTVRIPQSTYDAHYLRESYGLPQDPEEPDEVIEISSGDESDGDESPAKEEDPQKPDIPLIHLLPENGDTSSSGDSGGTTSTDSEIQIIGFSGGAGSEKSTTSQRSGGTAS